MNISQFNAVFSKVCIVERSMYFSYQANSSNDRNNNIVSIDNIP